jgi:tRNA nucleotidyltransferase (CCA-adding enzyme)
MIETKLQELLDGEINLTQEHISQGSKSHTFIRDLLANKSEKDSEFPWLLEGDFLSGSYARGTKLHPLDDIDIMVIMDGEGLTPIDKGIRLTTHEIRGKY